MSQVDILRFVANVQQLFAPSIHEGQTFIAYLDEEDNSYLIQGDNLSFEGSGTLGGEVEKLQQNLDALQTVINTLQPIVDELSGSNAINIVDDIVFGYCDSSFNPENLADLKGRPFLYFDGYSFCLMIDNRLASGGDSQIQLSQEITAGSVFAGFGDGKIHTIVEDNYNELGYGGCKDIQHGQLILCNADGEFYTFDANNHKFIRAGNGRHYVVDMIIDYVGETLPTTFTNEGTLFLDISYGLTLSYMAKKYSDQLTNMGYIEPDIGFRFANIQSILSDDAGIYAVEGEYDKCIRVIHDLQDRDTIFCKADGCTYTFSDNGTTKSFIRTSTPAIAPVLDIVSITDDSSYSPSANEDKYIYYDPIHAGDSAWLYSKQDWDDGRQIQAGERYASLDNHRIYEFLNNKPVFPVAIPVGVPFLNKADNEMYVFDGSQFVKACGTQQNNYAPVIAPVLDVIPITDDSSYSPSAAGDKYIYYDPSGSGAYGYFYTAPNNYEWGSPRDIQQGERYASTIDFKLYEFQRNYEEAIISDIPIGVPFLNKSDSCLYVYDGSDFVKIGDN